MYLQYKKEQMMVDTNESKKAEALWQTLRLSSAICDGLIFLLSILRSTNSISVLAPQTLFSAPLCFTAWWPELAWV